MTEPTIDLREPSVATDDDIARELWRSGREVCAGYFALAAVPAVPAVGDGVTPDPQPLARWPWIRVPQRPRVD